MREQSVVNYCLHLSLGPRVEAESGVGHEGHPWDLGKPAAFDLTVTSKLNSS